METEVERDERGRIVRVTRTGYDIDTPLGQAVVDAMERERAAEVAMEQAWRAWLAAGGSEAQAEQLHVDQLNSVLRTYPPELARARARSKELGCK